MDTIKLSLDIVNPSEFHNLGIELWLDKNKFFDELIKPGVTCVTQDLELNNGDHYFKIQLKNKVHDHTKIDELGNIVSDVLISFSNVTLDEINIDQLMLEKGEYIHNGNGSKTIAIHPYYGNMGCNGHVQLKFSSPVYPWLLENM